MNAFAVIVHLPVCRETLNKEVVAFHCSQEKGEQLKTRSSHVPWNERDSASGQFSMQVACSQDPQGLICGCKASLFTLTELCLHGDSEGEGRCCLGGRGQLCSLESRSPDGAIFQ